MKLLVFIFILTLPFISCKKIDLFEKTVAIPKQQWYYDNKPAFTFTITDTSSYYNIFIVLRHTDAYKYNNIWLQLGTQAPGDSIHFQNLDVTLGNDAKGWEGKGMDDIYEFRKNISPGPIHIRKAGTYTFTVAHIMREDPLGHILNVGVRIEKVRM